MAFLQAIHDFICQFFFRGVAPDWLLKLHQWLGVGG